MGRITQAEADKVSKKLVEKIGKEIVKAKEELVEYIGGVYKATIPQDVMRMWKRGKVWLHSTSSVYLRGSGLTDKWRHYYTGDHYPCKGSNTPELELDAKQAAHAVKLIDRVSDLEKKKKDTETEIYNLLLSLGTWKRAIEQLPEIKDYAPADEKRGLMVIPKQTREKIQCLVQPENNKCLETIIK